MNSSCCRAKKLVEYFGEDFSSEKCLLYVSLLLFLRFRFMFNVFHL